MTLYLYKNSQIENFNLLSNSENATIPQDTLI